MSLLEVRNPRSGQVDARIPIADAAAVQAEATRLRFNQPAWRAAGLKHRVSTLRCWAEALQSQAPTLVEALTQDTGRRALSRIEALSLQGLINRWTGQAEGVLARASPANQPTANPAITTSTLLRPYGLVGCISPWNFPLTLSTIDAIPALLAGCAVLVKPSEITPRFVEPLLETVRAAPGLGDVFGFVQGPGATGAALVDAVDMVCFTGSVATGRRVAEQAAGRFIPACLELGGKDPIIILASADPEKAAAVALRASVVNTGQACQSIERIYVARPIAEAFLAALVAQAQAVRLNAPDIAVGDIGPFISAAQAGIVQAQIEDALAKGARALTGGVVETIGGGLYLRPTVLVDVTPDMAVLREETFGPVLPVVVFDTADEAAALANAGDYGLSAAVIAATPEEAEQVGAQLNVGAVSINDGALTSQVWEAEKNSFGLSGLGPSRMGDAGLLRFLRKTALIRQSGPPLPLRALAEETANAGPS
jgi:succinate-semialdehyde dehydrogenase / glutarate-semialdehyde dehydrogenase